MRSGYVAAVLSSLLAGCQSKHVEQQRAQQVETETISASHADEQAFIYTAAISPASEVDLAAKTGGYVVSVAQRQSAGGGRRPVDVGDTVQAGETLARVSSPEIVAQFAQAQSGIGSAAAALEDARLQALRADQDAAQAAADWARAQRLYAKDALTKPDWEAAAMRHKEAVTQQASARANVDAQKAHAAGAQAERTRAGAQLAETKLRAPFTGVVTKRAVSIGGLIANGGPAFSIADLRQVRVAFSVPDTRIGDFHIGDHLPVRIDGLSNEAISGVVMLVAAAADAHSSAFRVELSLPNPKHRLRPGMIAAVSVPEEAAPSQAVLTVPVEALVHRPGMGRNYGVFIVKRHGGTLTAHLQNVQLGTIFGNSVVVQSGLAPGMKVIVKGGTDLTEEKAVAEAAQERRP